jgi:hypothetical protein
MWLRQIVASLGHLRGAWSLDARYYPAIEIAAIIPSALHHGLVSSPKIQM